MEGEDRSVIQRRKRERERERLAGGRQLYGGSTSIPSTWVGVPESQVYTVTGNVFFVLLCPIVTKRWQIYLMCNISAVQGGKYLRTDDWARRKLPPLFSPAQNTSTPEGGGLSRTWWCLIFPYCRPLWRLERTAAHGALLGVGFRLTHPVGAENATTGKNARVLVPALANGANSVAAGAR